MEWLLWVVSAILLCFGLVVLVGAPYVPTHHSQLMRAFDELYPLSSRDIVLDLGSGDGAVLLLAARKGASVIGYELNPVLVLISRWRLRGYANAQVVWGGYHTLKRLPRGVTVVYAFTTGHSIKRIEELIIGWSRHRPVSLISYGFLLPSCSVSRSIGPMHRYDFHGYEA